MQFQHCPKKSVTKEITVQFCNKTCHLGSFPTQQKYRFNEMVSVVERAILFQLPKSGGPLNAKELLHTF